MHSAVAASSTIADYTSCKRWFVSEVGGGTMVGQNGSCETRICCLRSRTQLAAQVAALKKGWLGAKMLAQGMCWRAVSCRVEGWTAAAHGSDGNAQALSQGWVFVLFFSESSISRTLNLRRRLRVVRRAEVSGSTNTLRVKLGEDIHLQEPRGHSRWNAELSRDLVYFQHCVGLRQLPGATLAPMPTWRDRMRRGS